jgi:hypothetical protein
MSRPQSVTNWSFAMKKTIAALLAITALAFSLPASAGIIWIDDDLEGIILSE